MGARSTKQGRVAARIPHTQRTAGRLTPDARRITCPRKANTTAYPGLLSPAATLGIRTLGVPVDTSGIDPDALEETLANWDEAERGGARPKFLLMVPTCSNPGGMTVPEQRKREIYAVCRRWDVMIIEDDPCTYYTYTTSRVVCTKSAPCEGGCWNEKGKSRAGQAGKAASRAPGQATAPLGPGRAC